MVGDKVGLLGSWAHFLSFQELVTWLDLHVSDMVTNGNSILYIGKHQITHHYPHVLSPRTPVHNWLQGWGDMDGQVLYWHGRSRRYI